MKKFLDSDVVWIIITSITLILSLADALYDNKIIRVVYIIMYIILLIFAIRRIFMK
jgi:hypothetical protein